MGEEPLAHGGGRGGRLLEADQLGPEGGGFAALQARQLVAQQQAVVPGEGRQLAAISGQPAGGAGGRPSTSTFCQRSWPGGARVAETSGVVVDREPAAGAGPQAAPPVDHRAPGGEVVGRQAVGGLQDLEEMVVALEARCGRCRGW